MNMASICTEGFAVEIKSIGLPPERHADRVVAEMMRQLARSRAHLLDSLCEIVERSSDGSPKAQRKMAARIKRAGAAEVQLEPGKRGRYRMAIYDFLGWDAERNTHIRIGDPTPDKPWVGCFVTLLGSEGDDELAFMRFAGQGRHGRAFELMQIADGTKTLAQIRASNAQANKRLRDRRSSSRDEEKAAHQQEVRALWAKYIARYRELAQWLMDHPQYSATTVAEWRNCSEAWVLDLRRWAKGGFKGEPPDGLDDPRHPQ